MYNVLNDLVRLSVETATELAEESGYKVRITEIDGEPTVTTREYNTERLNFRVRDNIVIDVSVG